jgi:hypothetical protein
MNKHCLVCGLINQNTDTHCKQCNAYLNSLLYRSNLTVRGVDIKFFATMSFAIAAIVPGVVINLLGLISAVIDGLNMEGLLMILILFTSLILVPAMIAGFFGYLFGTTLLDPSKEITKAGAMLRGVNIALNSLLIYSCLLSFIVGDLVLTIALAFLYSGWLVAPLGAIAGAIVHGQRSKVRYSGLTI